MAPKNLKKDEVVQVVADAAARHGIPVDDFLRASHIETGGRFDELAHNRSSGAKGLFQFMPATAEHYGIAGREFDAVANTDAAARLYLDNRQALYNAQARSGLPFLSGAPKPTGLDMYFAHQQGAAGYGSIQSALAGHGFTRDHTARNIKANIGDDLQAITGHSRGDLATMSDQQLAGTYLSYWQHKYDRIAMPAHGVLARQGDAPAGVQPMPVLRQGSQGDGVRQLQQQLADTGITGPGGRALAVDGDFGPRTRAAVEAFQRQQGLAADGVVGKATWAALSRQATQAVEAGPTVEMQAVGEGAWPAPGNMTINAADKAGEGRGEFGTSRAGGSRVHNGLDIQGQVGDPIVAYRDGTVLFAGQQAGGKGYGNYIVLEHADGSQSLYAHLERLEVREGETVGAGDRIATMGRSGNTPETGDTHLHFEIREGATPGARLTGTPVDPMGRFTQVALQPAEQPVVPAEAKEPLPRQLLDRQAQIRHAMGDRLSSQGFSIGQVDAISAAATAAMVRDGELAARDTRFLVGKDGQRVAMLYGNGVMREVDISGALTRSGPEHLQTAAAHLHTRELGMAVSPAAQARGHGTVPAI